MAADELSAYVWLLSLVSRGDASRPIAAPGRWADRDGGVMLEVLGTYLRYWPARATA